jgi:hypothetical protein
MDCRGVAGPRGVERGKVPFWGFGWVWWEFCGVAGVLVEVTCRGRLPVVAWQAGWTGGVDVGLAMDLNSGWARCVYFPPASGNRKRSPS